MKTYTLEKLCDKCKERPAEHGIARVRKEDCAGLVTHATYTTDCTECWNASEMYEQLKEKGALNHVSEAV